jgi:amidohydrolase
MTFSRYAALSTGALVLLASCAARPARGAPATQASVEAVLGRATELYTEIHAHPELSGHETKTASLLASTLRALGYEVTEGVGGTGVVAVKKNGPGRTVMIRTELDALPVLEKTGLAYASRERTRDDAGQDVPVMHACGHDLHMAAWVATATIAAANPQAFPGTLVFVAQPAEETLSGARRMLADGLFTRFPKPDVVFALHTHDSLPAGVPGYTLGAFGAASDSLDVTVYGRGGHGAYPEAVVDPIVIAARTVEALQTVVSRDKDPRDPAVLTVGAIAGGTKHNVVPDSVTLKLMLRTYTSETRTRALAAIRRVVAGEAASGGAPTPPTVTIVEHTEIASSDPALTRRTLKAVAAALPGVAPVELPKEMGSEDFSEYEHAGVPGVFLLLGVVPPDAYARFKQGGKPPPPAHSSEFSPDLPVTLRAAVRMETAALRELLAR